MNETSFLPESNLQISITKLTYWKQIVTKAFYIVNPADFDVPVDIVSVAHDSREVIIPEPDSADELWDKVW